MHIIIYSLCHKGRAPAWDPDGCYDHEDWGLAVSPEAVASIGHQGKADSDVSAFSPVSDARGERRQLASHRSSWGSLNSI